MKAPIKSFEIIKEMYEYFVKKYRDLEPKLMICEKEDFDNVETTLKDYEMEHTLRIRLENINYELVREKENNKKEIKAFEILRRKQFIYIFEENGEYWLSINMVAVSIPKEEYDVLKEVLL